MRSYGRFERYLALYRFALEATTFTLGHAAPDAETFVVGEGVVEAFGLNFAPGAYALGFACGTTFFREERFGVGLGAERAFLPAEFALVRAEKVVRDGRDQGEGDDVIHGGRSFGEVCQAVGTLEKLNNTDEITRVSRRHVKRNSDIRKIRIFHRID